MTDMGALLKDDVDDVLSYAGYWTITRQEYDKMLLTRKIISVKLNKKLSVTMDKGE